MKGFKFDYDKEDDVLYIQNAGKNVEESVEIAEDIVIDLDREGKVVGMEIFYASEFLSVFNKDLNKPFLENLEDAGLEYKELRNHWFIMLVLKSGKKIISQVMPPLRKSEYVSPLIASSQ